MDEVKQSMTNWWTGSTKKQRGLFLEKKRCGWKKILCFFCFFWHVFLACFFKLTFYLTFRILTGWILPYFRVSLPIFTLVAWCEIITPWKQSRQRLWWHTAAENWTNVTNAKRLLMIVGNQPKIRIVQCEVRLPEGNVFFCEWRSNLDPYLDISIQLLIGSEYWDSVVFRLLIEKFSWEDLHFGKVQHDGHFAIATTEPQKNGPDQCYILGIEKKLVHRRWVQSSFLVFVS